MDINQLLEKAIQTNASDLHFIVGLPPIFRINGVLQQLATVNPLKQSDVDQMVLPLLTPAQKEILHTNRALDFSYGYGGGNYGNKGRFRVNIYYQRGTIAVAFRLLPSQIKTIEALNLPSICHKLATLKQGFVLITGPTGHGKTTTIASIVNEINKTRAANIITIEDPIEYVFPQGKSIISQRELGHDTLSWGESLKSALREDPDVVVVGEMRDPESIASAITIAETGHLVFSTLHTNSASQSIDRIIDSFPESQQNQVKIQLAATLEAIISQRLIPTIEQGRILAAEVMLATNAVKANIREGKSHLIDSIIETSSNEGMITLESALANLVKEGYISLETAQAYALRPDSLNRLISTTQNI
jgi:twitching motility protein PilT